MVIKIIKSGKLYIADFIEFPGSPFVGKAKTSEEAIVKLFILNKNNLDKLNLSEIKIIKERVEEVPKPPFHGTPNTKTT